MLAFTDKVKVLKCYIPQKVKNFIEISFVEELKYYQKKYPVKIEILSDNNLIVPEYKIELLNKSKKVLNKLEYINKLEVYKNNNVLKFKREKKETKKIKKDTKKTKTKKKLRTLWIRRKKKLN